ncbi:MAG: hypothetical protein AAFX40_16795 [Cyanobacteria bacterium J06639_1]
MQSDDFVSLGEAVNALATLCEQRLTGLLYWETPQRQTATIGLSNGRIVSISCSSKMNQAALSLLSTLESIHYRFSSRSFYQPARLATLPDNAEILRLLGWGEDPLPAPKGAAVISDSGTDSLNAETRAALEALLTEYMGPVAAFVCQSAFDRAGSTSEAIALLAAEIPDPDDAKTFEATAKRQLNS